MGRAARRRQTRRARHARAHSATWSSTRARCTSRCRSVPNGTALVLKRPPEGVVHTLGMRKHPRRSGHGRCTKKRTMRRLAVLVALLAAPSLAMADRVHDEMSEALIAQADQQ